MSTLHQTQPTVQILLSSSDYVGALDIISTAQEVLQKELAGVLSFRWEITFDEITITHSLCSLAQLCFLFLIILVSKRLTIQLIV